MSDLLDFADSLGDFGLDAGDVDGSEGENMESMDEDKMGDLEEGVDSDYRQEMQSSSEEEEEEWGGIDFAGADEGDTDSDEAPELIAASDDGEKTLSSTSPTSPTQPLAPAGIKYVPPHLRQKSTTSSSIATSEAVLKLTRQLKGLFNRYVICLPL